MAFFSTLINQAGQIKQLTLHCNFLQAQLDREQERNELLEKGIRDERAKKDKFTLRYCDQVSKQASLPQKFVDDSEPKEPEKPKEFSPSDEERVNYYATIMRNGDIDAGEGQERNLDEYKDIIRAEVREKGWDAIVLN